MLSSPGVHDQGGNRGKQIGILLQFEVVDNRVDFFAQALLVILLLNKPGRRIAIEDQAPRGNERLQLPEPIDRGRHVDPRGHGHAGFDERCLGNQAGLHACV
ncbi:hypothetical protein D3C86_1689480 [compost metagenome]